MTRESLFMSNNRYSTLFFGMTLSMILFATSIIFELDLFEKFAEFTMRFEGYEFDEFIIPGFILILFAYINESRWRKTLLIDKGKSEIHQAMANASKQVIKDFISEIELFKTKMVNTNAFTTKELSIFTDALNEANVHLEALSSITHADEKKIYDTIVKSYGHK